MTKLEALDKFCTYFDYAGTKLAGETRVQFLTRKEKEWALSIVAQQVISEQEDLKQQAVSNQIAGVDL